MPSDLASCSARAVAVDSSEFVEEVSAEPDADAGGVAAAALAAAQASIGAPPASPVAATAGAERACGTDGCIAESDDDQDWAEQASDDTDGVHLWPPGLFQGMFEVGARALGPWQEGRFGASGAARSSV